MAPRDLSLRSRWKHGPAADEPGPVLVSFTQFGFHHAADLLAIWLAAERLGRELVRMPEARGVAIYLQPARRRVGSLSAWTSETGLRRFVSLPYHLQVVRRFRPRGAPLRATTWWTEEFERSAALAEGRRRVAG